jgi:type IV secretory pathway TraG/TraD family ATPase VirD4
MQGDSVTNNVPPVRPKKPLVSVKGVHKDTSSVFYLDEDILSKHMMLVGGTGCGKTTLFYHFVSQLKANMTDDDVMIIFDSKGDFHSKFYDSTKDVVIGNSPQYAEESAKWNIFQEILADGWSDASISSNAQQICKSLFAERTEGNNSNPFFPNAARDLLGALLISYIRAGRFDREKGGTFVQDCFNNADLKFLLDSTDDEYIIDSLSAHEDLKSVSSYISGKGGQSQGVLSEMYSVTRDILTGVFAGHGLFSTRRFVRNKGGKTLFIEYDLAIGSVLGPIYSLLFDLALREALGRTKSKGNVYFIIDELKLLPHLQHLDDGINFGRSLGVKILVGLQNIKQLEASYEEANARNIIYGFSTVFAFRSNDPETRKYASELFGKNIVLEQFKYSYKGFDLLQKEKEEFHIHDGNVVEDWDLTNLAVGEAIVGLTSEKPFRFKFDMYN